jgi:hypothetical protein
MSIVSQEQFVMLKFSYKDFKNIKKLYKKFHDINSKKYIAVCRQGLYGILDVETEKLIVPFKYQKICDFREGFAWVKAKNKWGFINKQFEEIVPPKFIDVFGLDNGGFDLGVINCVGNPDIDEESDELLKAYRSNRKTNPSIVYSRIEGFSEGLTPIKFRRKWGFVNTAGEMVVKPRYDAVKPFSFGLAAVMLNGKWGFVDPKGNLIIKNQFVDVSSFKKPSVGLAKREIRRPSSNKIMHYIYSMLQKVHVSKMTDNPFAQVEVASDDGAKIKIATIDLDGNVISKAAKHEIEIHAIIY